MLDLRQLRCFVTVIETASFTKAASALNVAQPAVSQQIQRLEQAVGEKLLIRNGRGIQLTQAGERLFPHALTILGNVEAAQTEIQEFRNGAPSGILRVGLPGSLTDTLAVALFEECESRFPGIKLRAVERQSENLNELLVQGRLDLIFAYETTDLDWIGFELIREEVSCLICAPGDPAPGTGGPISFREVAALPLILPSPANEIRLQLDNIAARQGCALNVVTEIDSFRLLHNLVAAGRGCTILPPLPVISSLAAGDLVGRPIVEPRSTRRLHYGHSLRQPPSRAQLAVRDLVADIVERASSRWQPA
jgi:LysR family nitrogen assimilation transcriptional regulator